MVVIGIDPGSHHCGYGVVAREGSRLRVVASGVIEGGKGALPERLAAILDGLTEVIARTRPDEAAVEQVHSGPSPRSALVLGQARGVALAVAGRAGLPVFEYQPSTVKLAFTGNGRAGKEQMVRTARQLLGLVAGGSDEADAVAIAVCHLSNRTARLVAATSSTARLAAATSSTASLAAPPSRTAAALGRLRPARRDHRRQA